VLTHLLDLPPRGAFLLVGRRAYCRRRFLMILLLDKERGNTLHSIGRNPTIPSLTGPSIFSRRCQIRQRIRRLEAGGKEWSHPGRIRGTPTKPHPQERRFLSCVLPPPSLFVRYGLRDKVERMWKVVRRFTRRVVLDRLDSPTRWP